MKSGQLYLFRSGWPRKWPSDPKVRSATTVEPLPSAIVTVRQAVHGSRTKAALKPGTEMELCKAPFRHFFDPFNPRIYLVLPNLTLVGQNVFPWANVRWGPRMGGERGIGRESDTYCQILLLGLRGTGKGVRLEDFALCWEYAALNCCLKTTAFLVPKFIRGLLGDVWCAT